MASMLDAARLGARRGAAWCGLVSSGSVGSGSGGVGEVGALGAVGDGGFGEFRLEVEAPAVEAFAGGWLVAVGFDPDGSCRVGEVCAGCGWGGVADGTQGVAPWVGEHDTRFDMAREVGVAGDSEGAVVVVRPHPGTAQPGVAEDLASLVVGHDDAEVGHQLDTVGPGFEMSMHQIPVGAGPGGFTGLQRGLRQRHQSICGVDRFGVDTVGSITAGLALQILVHRFECLVDDGAFGFGQPEPAPPAVLIDPRRYRPPFIGSGTIVGFGIAVARQGLA